MYSVGVYLSVLLAKKKAQSKVNVCVHPVFASCCTCNDILMYTVYCVL